MSSQLPAKTFPHRKQVGGDQRVWKYVQYTHTNKADILPEELQTPTCHKSQKSAIVIIVQVQRKRRVRK